MEKQIGIFAKRVEAERRDAWVARSRVGLLEVEKTGLEKALEDKCEAVKDVMSKSQALENECISLRRCIAELQGKLEMRQEAENECIRLRNALEEERRKVRDLERELDKADMLTTPIAKAFESKVGTPPTWVSRGLGFTSMDSSVTAVDDSPPMSALKVVVEEEENAFDISDEENPLASYEDEQDSDLSFQSSSLGSMDEFPRSTSHLQVNSLPCVSASPVASSCEDNSTHMSHVSLSKTWTFPRGPTVSSLTRQPEEVDRFFGCLDDIDDSPPMRSITPTQEGSKGLFTQAIMADDNDESLPFVLPNGVGVEEISTSPPSLDDVKEDERNAVVDEEVLEEEMGGIRITFTPPEPELEALEPEIPVCPMPSELNEEPAPLHFTPPTPKTPDATVNAPFMEDGEDDDLTFNFGRPTSASPLRTRSGSLSSIPRFSPSKQFIASNDVLTSTPPKSRVARYTPTGHSSNTYVTPPSKRGGTMPSFIPQAVPSTSLKKNVPQVKQNPAQRASFIRQPQRKPAPVALPKINSNGSPLKPSLNLPLFQRQKRQFPILQQ